MSMRAIGLWCGALGFVAASSGAGCSSSNERPPPAGFGAPVTGGASGDTGTGGSGGRGGRGGTGGKGGTGGTSNGGASGDQQAGFGGEFPGGAGSGGGGRGGKDGNGGVGNLGARGGGGNETAEGGALSMGPDLDCPKVAPSVGSNAPVCGLQAMWGMGVDALTMPSPLDLLMSITPDELSISWLYAQEGEQTLYVADRLNLADDFGMPRKISDPSAMSATQTTLGPDRLSLVVVAGGQFVEFVRATTTDDFAYAGSGHFATIDLDAATAAGTLADPVLAADDATLYYTLQTAELDGPTLFVAHRLANDDFDHGKPLDECNLDRAETGVRRPTGISADQRTLFYYDEPRAMARAAWRSSPTAPFDTFVDLPGWTGVEPNASCDRLYYSTMTDAGFNILVSTEK